VLTNINLKIHQLCQTPMVLAKCAVYWYWLSNSFSIRFSKILCVVLNFIFYFLKLSLTTVRMPFLKKILEHTRHKMISFHPFDNFYMVMWFERFIRRLLLGSFLSTSTENFLSITHIRMIFFIKLTGVIWRFLKSGLRRSSWIVIH